LPHFGYPDFFGKRICFRIDLPLDATVLFFAAFVIAWRSLLLQQCSKIYSMHIFLAAIAVLIAFTSSAEARTHRHRHYAYHVHYQRHFAHQHRANRLERAERNRVVDQQQFTGLGIFAERSSIGLNDGRVRRSEPSRYRYADSGYHHVLGGRPAAWCGW
jgi:hypothetical protein